jgi:hypothetical protein
MAVTSLALSLLVCVAPSVVVESAMAQTAAITTGPLAGFLLGQVSEIGSQHILINNKRYELRDDAVLRDDRDRPRQLKDFEVESHVAYHVKYGRIDEMVLLLPR